MQLIGLFLYNAIRDIIDGKVKLEDVYMLAYVDEIKFDIRDKEEIITEAVSFHETCYGDKYDSFSINLILTYFFENNRMLFFETVEQREAFIRTKTAFRFAPIEEEVSDSQIWVYKEEL